MRDLTEANKILKELRDFRPTIKYKKASERLQNMEVLSLSDLSFNISAGRDYGQTGVEICIETFYKDGQNIFHPIDWTSKKQKGFSHSSDGAEILACAKTEDRSFYIKQALKAIKRENTIPHILHVDSRGLFDKISTFHDGKEYRARQTVQIIRDSL